MSSYHQFCPVARAAEILAERWTPIIVRNLLIGCNTYSAIEQGAPGIPKTLLVQRLRKLEHYGVLERHRNPTGRGSTYELTPSGLELLDVVFALGQWGMRWLEVAPEHLDPGIVLWALSKTVIRDRLPNRRLVVRFTLTGRPRLTAWALVDNGEMETCATHPGGDEDLIVTADPQWLVRWHFRRSTWRRQQGRGTSSWMASARSCADSLHGLHRADSRRSSRRVSALGHYEGPVMRVNLTCRETPAEISATSRGLR